MATIHTEKIGHVASVAPGATHHFGWKNPPWNTVLGYFAYPVPPSPSGPHGAATGSVAVTRVTCTYVIDHYNGDRQQVTVDVLNTGSEPTGFDLYQSWIS